MELIEFDINYSQINIFNDLVATIGEFDGIHLAHQLLINETVSLAKQLKAKAALITFSDHPDYVLGKREFQGYLSPLNEKRKIIEKMGIDYLINIKFNKETSLLKKDEFYNIVFKNLKALVLGYDYRFAYLGEGDTKYLKDKFSSRIIKIIDKLEFFDNNEENSFKIGSDLIRRYLEEGNIRKANELLGREYTFEGNVIEGKKLGRTWNFPTANINVYDDKFKVKKGVYAVSCFVKNKYYYGIANFGNNPTCNYNELTRLEVHLFDFNEDIYNEYIECKLIDFIREEKKFSSKEELIERIKLDKKEALKIIGGLK